jgi:hypothetical protein
MVATTGPSGVTECSNALFSFPHHDGFSEKANSYPSSSAPYDVCGDHRSISLLRLAEGGRD